MLNEFIKLVMRRKEKRDKVITSSQSFNYTISEQHLIKKPVK